jgi:uncharacterized protein (DUF697 family)
MAKLYFCNNGDIELQPETLSILSGMPRGWNVLLNARPANPGGVDREVDALITTEKAVHLVEFKFRSKPIVIDAEGYWHAGGKRMENTSRRESPQEQVLATHDAFKQWLVNRALPEFGLAPWVVLENPNPHNQYGGVPFRVNWYEPAGKTWLVNGVERLESLLKQRERREASLQRGVAPTRPQVERMVSLLGGQPLETMVIQGTVLTLDGGNPLAGVPVKVFSGGGESPRVEQSTSQDGRFEVAGLPVGPFRVELDLRGHDGWKAVPEVENPGRPGFAPIRIFVAHDRLTDAELHRLLEPELLRFQVELQDEILSATDDLEGKLAEVRSQLASQEELLLELIGRQNTPPNVREAMEVEVARLRTEEQQLEAWTRTDAEGYVESALLPIRDELCKLTERVDSVERTAREAFSAATEAAKNSERTKIYEETRARIEEQRYRDDKETKALGARHRQQMSEALKWSAIVGGAGGIISMQPIPFADNMILTPLQIGLVMHIGRIYGTDFTKDLAFKLVGPLGMGFLAQHGTVLLYKLIPGAWGLGAITVPAFTIALGWAAAKYFEQGSAPSREEQKQVLKRSLALVKDAEIRDQMKDLGATLVKEVKARKYRVAPEDIKEILGRLGQEGKGIGEQIQKRLAPEARSEAAD